MPTWAWLRATFSWLALRLAMASCCIRCIRCLSTSSRFCAITFFCISSSRFCISKAACWLRFTTTFLPFVLGSYQVVTLVWWLMKYCSPCSVVPCSQP